MGDILDLDTRKKIFETISTNPGVHLSKIAELLQMRTSLVEYHLLFLIKHEIIYLDKSTGFNQYYVKGSVGTADKRMLSLFRRRHILEIILYLLRHETAQHKEILDNIDVSASTLSYHLNKLVKNDIIEVQRYGDNKGYSLKRKDETIRVLLEYKPFNLLDGFEDVWNDLSI